MARKKDNGVESAAEVEDRVSISTISLDVEENSTRGRNKVHPLGDNKNVEMVEDQLDTPAIFKKSVEEGRIVNFMGFESQIYNLPIVRVYSY